MTAEWLTSFEAASPPPPRWRLGTLASFQPRGAGGSLLLSSPSLTAGEGGHLSVCLSPSCVLGEESVRILCLLMESVFLLVTLKDSPCVFSPRPYQHVPLACIPSSLRPAFPLSPRAHPTDLEVLSEFWPSVLSLLDRGVGGRCRRPCRAAGAGPGLGSHLGRSWQLAFQGVCVPGEGRAGWRGKGVSWGFWVGRRRVRAREGPRTGMVRSKGSSALPRTQGSWGHTPSEAPGGPSWV